MRAQRTTNACRAGVVATLVVAAAAAVAVGAAPQQAVTICHRVGGDTFSRLTIAPQAVIGGHAGQHPLDIIPPFTHGPGGSDRFAGQNWDVAGIITWLNGCRGWTPPDGGVDPILPGRPVRPIGPAQPIVEPPGPDPSWPTLPTRPIVVAPPVTYCLATGDGYTVTTSAPGALVRHIVESPSSIVPPFMVTAGGRAYGFPGLNWNAAGQATWDAGCIAPDGAEGGSAGSATSAARVAVTITPSTYRPRPGAIVTFTVRGRAGGSEAAVQPRMCAIVPRTLTVVAVRGGTARPQAACWLTGLTGQGTSIRSFRARVAPGTGGLQINARAAIDARNTSPARALATIFPMARRAPVTG